MTIHPDNATAATEQKPAVYVDALSFRYRSLDDEPETKRIHQQQILLTPCLPLRIFLFRSLPTN